MTEPASDGSRRLTMFELARLEEARRRAAEVDVAVRRSASTTRDVRRPSWMLLGALLCVAATAVLRLLRPVEELAAERRYEREIGAGAEVELGGPTATSARPGYGKSGNVLVRVAMPGQIIEYPLTLRSDPVHLAYQWVRASDSSQADAPRPLGGPAMVAPAQPGLYHLAVLARTTGATPQVLGDITLAVLVPFSQKMAGQVNGYRIGSYPFERFGGERPIGFLEVDRRNVDVPLTRHLRLADFVTHDEQSVWPKYAAVSPRLLDKLELVVDEVARIRGVTDPLRIEVDVHSGFRTPLHNSSVEGAALNSRHQYGDAADVAIDADGDGRLTAFDSRLVALAAEMVEKRNPDLVGGLGVYVSPKYRTPYVHIDARGKRARWWG
ncbi:Peptidase M15A [Gemmatirosa kalamazoonensis]|uniref:Peptidase M15A n=1 Tax=Gemmatirosa kalamazoonensis TaxID=861299 RepID=W0RPN5_9BACT|nr:D-Ala-D-Ala carboxypeptidase family metallohydrolase [Gemmatirosa kalamazoonensis]AHG91458.1 Peptidase M15A [Gemmatirosa kalamazoonensis]